MKKMMGVKKVIAIVVIALLIGLMSFGIYKTIYDISETSIVKLIVEMYKYSYDSRHSIDMALNYMEKKYGESFYYVRRGEGDMSYDTHIVTCDSFPGKEIKVEIHGIGTKKKNYIDGYLAAKYEEDIKKMLEDNSLKYFSNVLVFGVADSESTSGELSAQASLKDVLADEEFRLSVDIILKKSDVISKDTIDNMLYEMFKESSFKKLNSVLVDVDVVPDDVYAKLEIDEKVDWNEVAISYRACAYKHSNGYSGIDWMIIDEKELEYINKIQNIGENTTNDWNNDNKLSDRWEDGEFLYDNKKLKLMCNFISDLGKLRTTEREINEMVISKLYTGEWYVLNSSEEIKSTLECEIYGIKAEIDKKEYEENPSKYSEIQLSKGITWKSTVEDIINAYGEPQKTEKRIWNDTYIILSYEADNGNSLELTVHEDFGLTGILLKSEI